MASDNAGYTPIPDGDEDRIIADTACVDSDSSDEPLLDDHKPEAPPHLHDRYHMIKIIFGLLGLVSVAPWAVFVTATQCWDYKFRDINSTFPSHDKTQLQIYFNSYLSIAYNAPFIMVVLLMMFFGHKITATIRSVFSMLMIMAFMFATTVMVKINSDQWQQEFLLIILTISVGLSVCSAALLSSISGVISSFPPQYIQATVSGQAAAGLLAVLFQILSLFITKSDVATSAMYYFIAADVLLVVTFIAYLIVRRAPYYRYYRKRGILTVSLDTISERSIANRSDLVAIIKNIWVHLVSTFLIYFGTMAVFPAVAVLISPKQRTNMLTNELFQPIFCFLIFNLLDLFGRILAKWIPVPQNKPYLLLLLSSSRMILIFAIMMCNIKPPAKTHFPTFFESEYIFGLFIALLGITNGYGYTVTMFQAPSCVLPELREKTGFVLTTSLAFGCIFGAIISSLLIKIL